MVRSHDRFDPDADDLRHPRLHRARASQRSAGRVGSGRRRLQSRRDLVLSAERTSALFGRKRAGSDSASWGKGRTEAALARAGAGSGFGNDLWALFGTRSSITVPLRWGLSGGPGTVAGRKPYCGAAHFVPDARVALV